MPYLPVLFDYNAKFAEETLKALRTVPHEKFLTEKISGHGSLRDTMVHIIQTEDYWLHKVICGEQFTRYNVADFANIDSLEKQWRRVHEEYRQLLASLTADALQEKRKVTWDKEYEFALETVLQHVYTHTVHHRGQVIAGIRLLGGEPPYVDII